MAVKCPKCNFENPAYTKFCGECSAPLPSSKKISVFPTETLETPKEELTTGSFFAGRYQIIEALGKGGMGKVYRVLDKKLNEEVALKLVRPEIASDKKTLERFSNELKIARKIAHKNVGRMYEMMEEKGIHFVTMEYVSGEDLKSFIKRAGPLSAGKTTFIAKQVCEGLAEAHKLGVVHRDLKPQNIMIDKEGNSRIMDFGIARSRKAKGITADGMIIGTPEYMSPEQVEGKEADHRSDIYSIGVILYEMVTGRIPFEGDAPLSIVLKHKTETPRDPRELNAQIPDDLSHVILKCLEKNKEKRYQAAEEILSEVGKIEKHIPTSERIAPKRKTITSKEITVTFGLKKLFIPALVLIALVAVGLIIWQPWLQKEVAPAPSAKPSIAVLPFKDLSPQKDQEYFCEGLADELINRLTKIESLKVPARTSSFSFKEKGLAIQEIGKNLDVKTVLEGSVRKAENKLRITVQLVKVSDGYPIWSEKFDRNMEDIFSLQDEISLAIINNLKIELLGQEEAKLVKRYTENFKAHNSYLQGLYFWNRRTKEGMEKAVEYFKKAIEEDPQYALAYSGISDSYSLLGYWGFLELKEAYPKAKAAAMKALEIDDMLAEAHASLASIKAVYEWDWQETERGFKRALELNPKYATARVWYGVFYLWPMGQHEEAMREVNRAQELDPLSPIINFSIGFLLYYSQQYDQAIEVFQNVLAMEPNFPPASTFLSMAYIKKGMYDKAIRQEIRASRFLGIWDERTIGAIENTYARSGFEAAVQKILDVTKNPSSRAWLYAFLEKKDEAFECLEQAYEQRDSSLLYLKTEPVFESLRSDPRFKALLKKVGLEK